MHVLRILSVVVLLTSVGPRPVAATFHEWKIDQAFSTPDGSVQYVDFVLPDATDDERSISLAHLSSGLSNMGFTNLPSRPTAGQHFLIASPGFATVAGVTPDFTFPTTPFFSFSGDTLNYGPNLNSLTFGQLPGGVMAWGPAGAVLNSPTNFSGQSGFFSDHPWRNSANPLDVNNVDGVTSLDALNIINELNQNGPHSLPVPAPTPPAFFYDPSGDDFISSLDALQVINFLNNQNQIIGFDQSQMAFDMAIATVPEPTSETLALVACAGIIISRVRAIARQNRCRRRAEAK